MSVLPPDPPPGVNPPPHYQGHQGHKDGGDDERGQDASGNSRAVVQALVAVVAAVVKVVAGEVVVDAGAGLAAPAREVVGGTRVVERGHALHRHRRHEQVEAEREDHLLLAARRSGFADHVDHSPGAEVVDGPRGERAAVGGQFGLVVGHELDGEGVAVCLVLRGREPAEVSSQRVAQEVWT